MNALAGIIAPVFALILLGAAAVHWRLVDAGGLRGLNDVTFYAGVPALLFSAVAEADALLGLDLAAAYFAACLVVFALAIAFAVGTLGMGLAQAAATGLNASYGNTVMLGIPIVSAAFGAPGLAVLMPIIMLHSVLLLPLASLLIEAGGAGGANPLRTLRRTLPSLVRNPVILSILLAIAWRLLGLSVPVPLHRFLALLGGAAPPLALFCLGASLPGFAVRGALREAGIATVLKLLLLPALVWGLAWLFGFGPLPTAVAVLTAGMPTGANAFLLARRTDTGAGASAGTVVVSTALSVLTLSVLLAWVRALPGGLP